MKHLICTLFAFLLSFFAIQAKDDGNVLNYEINCGGSAVQGYSLVKVKVTVKKAKDATDDLAKRCAVHGVVFRGYAGGQGCVSQPPLAGSAMSEQQYSDFYKPFFEKGGACAGYCTVIDGSMLITKVDKQYVASFVVNVARDRLRKDLESAGVIRKLSSGF